MKVLNCFLDSPPFPLPPPSLFPPPSSPPPPPPPPPSGWVARPPYYTSNKNFILKYFRCRDGKRTETRIGMEGICITHSCIPLYTVYMQHIMAHSGGMQEWVIEIPSVPILVSVLFPSLHLKYFRIKFLLLVFMRMRTKPYLHPV